MQSMLKNSLKKLLALAALLATCGAWAETYYWIGGATDSNWTTSANWSTESGGSALESGYPTLGTDTISIGANATVILPSKTDYKDTNLTLGDNVTFIVPDSMSLGTQTLNQSVIFDCNNNTISVSDGATVSGSATITIKSGKLSYAGTSNHSTVSCSLAFDAATIESTNVKYLTLNGSQISFIGNCSMNIKSTGRVTLGNGTTTKVMGDGIVTVACTYYKNNSTSGGALVPNADFSGFTGSVTVTSSSVYDSMYCETTAFATNFVNSCWSIYMGDSKVPSYTGNTSSYGNLAPWRYKGKTVLYGQLSMNIPNVGIMSTDCKGNTIKIGYLDKDCYLGGTWYSGSDYPIVWVAPTATLTNTTSNTYKLEVTGGGEVDFNSATTGVPSDSITLSGNGGYLKYDSTSYSSVTNKLKVSNAPLGWDVPTGDNCVFDTSLLPSDSSISAFMKKGHGTLRLAQAYTGTATVNAGKLLVPTGSTITKGTTDTVQNGTETVEETVYDVYTRRYHVTLPALEHMTVTCTADYNTEDHTYVAPEGADVTFTITPTEGYMITSDSSTLTIGSISADTTISSEQLPTVALIVAKIGTTNYASFEDAVGHAVKGDTIELCTNVTLTGDLTIADGVTVSAGEYSITLGDYGVYYADGYHELDTAGNKICLRTAYVWVGGASGNWIDGTKWNKGGNTGTAPSLAADKVLITNETEITMTGGRTGQLMLEANVTMKGTLTNDVIRGSGMVTFNGSSFVSGSTVAVYCDAYLTGTISGGSSEVSFHGRFMGDATISFTEYQPGFHLYGDASDFRGDYTGGRYTSKTHNYTRDGTLFYNGLNGQNASWTVGYEGNSSGFSAAVFATKNATYKFGKLTSPKFTMQNVTGSTVEVGSLAGTTSDVTGVEYSLYDDSNTFRKVGETSVCNLYLDTSKGTIEVSAGTLNHTGANPKAAVLSGATAVFTTTNTVVPTVASALSTYYTLSQSSTTGDVPTNTYWLTSNYEVAIGETRYASFAAAKAVANGATITLLKDVTASCTMTSGEVVVVDRNGFTANLTMSPVEGGAYIVTTTEEEDVITYATIPTYTLTIPNDLPANLAVSSVSTNGVELTPAGGPFTVVSNTDVKVVFVGARGYAFDAPYEKTISGVSASGTIAYADVPTPTRQPATYTRTGDGTDTSWTTLTCWSAQVGEGTAYEPLVAPSTNDTVIIPSGFTVNWTVNAADTNVVKSLGGAGTLQLDVSAMSFDTKRTPVEVVDITEGLAEGNELTITAVNAATGYSGLVAVMEEDTKVFVTIVANTDYVWQGGSETDYNWGTTINWKKGNGDALEAGAFPSNAADVVIFPQSQASTKVTVNVHNGTSNGRKNILGTWNSGGTIVFNCNTMLVGTSDNIRICPTSVYGAGTISLKNSGFEGMNNSTLTINNDIIILPGSDGDPWSNPSELYVRAAKDKQMLTGKVSGTGCLALSNYGGGYGTFAFSGDTSTFAGQIKAANTLISLEKDDALDWSKVTLDLASGARLETASTCTDTTLKIGVLTGDGTITNKSTTVTTLQVGLDDATIDATMSITLGNNSQGGAWTALTKVGASTQTFTMALTSATTVTVEGGTLVLPSLTNVTLGTDTAVQAKTDDAVTLVACAAPEASLNGAAYVTFTNALALANGSTITLLNDVADTVTLTNNQTCAVIKNEKTLNLVAKDATNYTVSESTSEAGVTTYTCAVKDTVYRWIGPSEATATTNWSDAANWTKGTEHVAPSATTDVVYIPAGEALTFAGGASKDAAIQLGNLTADRDVTFSGFLKLDDIQGTGTITFDGAFITEGTDHHIHNDIVVNSTFCNATLYCIYLDGKVTGSGKIYNESGAASSVSEYNGFHFSGDVSAFAGTYVGGDRRDNVRDYTYFQSGISTSSNATWTIGCDGDGDKNDEIQFKTDNDTYYFGQLTTCSGWFIKSRTGLTLEIGALGTNSTMTSKGSFNGNTIRKVGKGDLSLNMTNVGKVILTEGQLTVGENLALTELELTGPNTVTCSIPASVAIDTKITFDSDFTGTLVLTGGGILAANNAEGIVMNAGTLSVLAGTIVTPKDSSLKVNSTTTVLVTLGDGRVIVKPNEVYLWTGEAGALSDGTYAWEDSKNWSVRGDKATDYPHGADVEAEFASMFASEVDVKLSQSVEVKSLAVWATVALKTENNATLTLASLTGQGTLELTDDMALVGHGATTLEAPIKVTADTDHPAAIRDTTTAVITIDSALSGNGTLEFGTSGAYYRLNGNNASFEGTIVATNTPIMQIATGAGSAKASWIMDPNKRGDNGDNGNVVNSGSTVSFGAYHGNYWRQRYSSAASGSQITIGALNSNSEISGGFACMDGKSYPDRSDALIKVGTGTLTSTAVYYNHIDIDDGTLYLAADPKVYSKGYIYFGGGVLRFSEALTNTDVSAWVQSSTAALKVAVDAGVTNTWGTTIASSNAKAEIEKSGAGTLMLTNKTVWSWSGKPLCTVSEGDLILPSGTSYTLGNFTTNDVTYTAGIRLVSIPTNIVAGTSREIFAESAEAASNLVSQIKFELSPEAEAVGQQLSYFTTNITQAATESGTIRFVVSSELNPDVVDPINTDSTMTGTTSGVAVTPGNVKKGLYYRLLSGTSQDAITTADAEHGYQQANEDGAALSLTNTVNATKAKVLYYKVLVSDTGR